MINGLDKIKKVENEKALSIKLPVSDFKTLKIPGMSEAKMGTCYVRVVDLPKQLENYMGINPRIPSRSLKGALKGPVVKGILETLLDNPSDMSLKNQGIYLLVKQAFLLKADDGIQLKLVLNDTSKHGIVNGGHTFAAIREAIETATPDEIDSLRNAYVQLHVFEGIPTSMVAEIAEGLNRSKQVDDVSLINLQGEFELLQKHLKGIKGENEIAFHQGDEGSLYVSELLVLMYLFDTTRFGEDRSPNVLYNRHSLGIKYFKTDLKHNKRNIEKLSALLPDILKLSDMIRFEVPGAAKRNKFKFGMTKLPSGRAAQKVFLPFIEQEANYRVPNGWVFPILSAFRANLRQEGKHLKWIVPIEDILPALIDQLVAVCVNEHKYNGARPEEIGKKDSSYQQCFSRVQLYLAKKNLL